MESHTPTRTSERTSDAVDQVSDVSDVIHLAKDKTPANNTPSSNVDSLGTLSETASLISVSISPPLNAEGLGANAPCSDVSGQRPKRRNTSKVVWNEVLADEFLFCKDSAPDSISKAPELPTVDGSSSSANGCALPEDTRPSATHGDYRENGASDASSSSGNNKRRRRSKKLWEKIYAGEAKLKAGFEEVRKRKRVVEQQRIDLLAKHGYVQPQLSHTDQQELQDLRDSVADKRQQIQAYKALYFKSLAQLRDAIHEEKVERNLVFKAQAKILRALHAMSTTASIPDEEETGQQDDQIERLKLELMREEEGLKQEEEELARLDRVLEEMQKQ